MLSTRRRRAAIVITKSMIDVLVLLPLLLQLLAFGTSMIADAFHPTSKVKSSLLPLMISTSRHYSATTTRKSSPTQLGCICVNCKWVTSCKAYHFVEKKHEQPHMSEEPTFLPREGSPTINVNIRSEQRTPKPKAGIVDKTDAAVAKMWKDQIREDEYEKNGNIPSRDATYYEETGTIEAVSTNTTTTIEYDVVKCADFVLEKGCWVRNMPEEIKRVNPDFVPT